MKSYLLSWLRKNHAGAKLDEFVAARAGDWLVWEAGPWRPPTGKRETLQAGPQTRFLSSGESLAIQLRSKSRSAQVKLGRDVENDVVIDDGTLSRVHLVFERDPAGAWTVRDAGSRNGSLVDERTLGPKPVLLRPGSRIDAGAVRLTFYDAAGLYARMRTAP